MAKLNESVLEICSKLKEAPIAIVYGVPMMMKKRIADQAPIDDIIEKSMVELDGFLEVNNFKTSLIPFNEFKSTQISSIVMQSLSNKKTLDKQVNSCEPASG